MRKFFKIFLVLAAVAFTAGVTLHFMETRLGPPRKVKRTDAILDFAEQEAREIRNTMSLEDLHRRFFKAAQLIGFLSDSKLVGPMEGDALMTEAMRRYAPPLGEQSLFILKNLPWDGAQLEMMDKHAACVLEMRRSDGSRIIKDMGREKCRMDSVRNTTVFYRKALGLLQEDRYRNIATSDSVMREAGKFREDSLLHNNRVLMLQLDTLAMRLENSHFSCLKDNVRLMSSYKQMGSKEMVLQHYAHYIGQLEDYEKKAEEIYGGDSLVTAHLDSVETLKKHLAYYRDKGVAHYNLEAERQMRRKRFPGYSQKWRKTTW